MISTIGKIIFVSFARKPPSSGQLLLLSNAKRVVLQTSHMSFTVISTLQRRLHPRGRIPNAPSNPANVSMTKNSITVRDVNKS